MSKLASKFKTLASTKLQIYVVILILHTIVSIAPQKVNHDKERN